jgi:hypothetical protein
MRRSVDFDKLKRALQASKKTAQGSAARFIAKRRLRGGQRGGQRIGANACKAIHSRCMNAARNVRARASVQDHLPPLITATNRVNSSPLASPYRA